MISETTPTLQCSWPGTFHSKPETNALFRIQLAGFQDVRVGESPAATASATYYRLRIVA